MEQNILLRIKVIGSPELEDLQKKLRTVTSFVEKYSRTIQEYDYAQQAGIQATDSQTKAYERAQKFLPYLIQKQSEYKAGVASLTTSLTTEANAIRAKEQADKEAAIATQKAAKEQEKATRIADKKAAADAKAAQAQQSKTSLDTKAAQSQNQLNAVIEGESTVRGRNTQRILENKVATNALIAQKKLEITTTSTEVGAYARLVAEMQLAENALLDMGAAGVTSGAGFDAAKIKASGLRDQVNKLHTATGAMGKGMNNAYNSTFQMTQVMRELPNFAIDARIGFMSLSNNLPMLADGFKQLANQVDATGKKMGNAYAWKTMGKSILSLNTIMIVGVTAMVLYGDKLIDMLNGSESSLKTFHDELKKGEGLYSDAVKNITEAGSAINLYKTGVIDSTEFLKQMNEALGDNVNKFKDENEAIAWYVQNSGAYLEAMEAQAMANAYLAKVVTYRSKAEFYAAQDSVSNFQTVGKSFSLLWEYIKDLGSNEYILGGIVKMSKRTIQYLKDMGNAESLILQDRNNKRIKNNAKADEEEAKYQKKMAESWAKLKDLMNPPDEKKSNTNVSSQVESYNHLAEALKTVQEAREELATSEETLGVKNPYILRITAANTWLETEKEIIEEDRRLSTQSETEKYNSDKKKLESDLKNATDRKTAQQTYNKEIEVLNKNHSTELTKIDDAYNNSKIDAENKRNEWVYKINNDYSKRNIEQNNEDLQAFKNSLEDEQQALVDAENKRYDVDILRAKNNKEREIKTREHKLNLIRIEATYSEQLLQLEIDNLKMSLNEQGLSDSEKEALQKQLNQKELDLKKKHNDNIAKLDEAGTQESVSKFKISQDQKQEILEASLSTLSSAFETYFNYQNDLLDKQLDKQLDALSEQEDAQIDSLDKQKEYGLISDISYNKKKEQIQKEYDKKEEELKKQAFEKDKKLKLKQAAMEYAMGVIRIWATHPEPITAAILTGLLTIATGVEMAAINAEQYATGGKVKDSNIPQQSNGDNVLATLKTDEVVLTKEHQKALGGDQTFKAIGVPGFATGGKVIKSYSSAPIPANMASRITSAVMSANDMVQLVKLQTEESVKLISDIVDAKIVSLKVYIVESEITDAHKKVDVSVLQSKLL
ncbi:MAG: hypothetical protein WCX48_08490 [Bacteroidales bacterium]